jgi:hypothetical protein
MVFYFLKFSSTDDVFFQLSKHVVLIIFLGNVCHIFWGNEAIDLIFAWSIAYSWHEYIGPVNFAGYPNNFLDFEKTKDNRESSRTSLIAGNE